MAGKYTAGQRDMVEIKQNVIGTGAVSIQVVQFQHSTLTFGVFLSIVSGKFSK
jgi:hypothetical protein